MDTLSSSCTATYTTRAFSSLSCTLVSVRSVTRARLHFTGPTRAAALDIVFQSQSNAAAIFHASNTSNLETNIQLLPDIFHPQVP